MKGLMVGYGEFAVIFIFLIGKTNFDYTFTSKCVPLLILFAGLHSARNNTM